MMGLGRRPRGRAIVPFGFLTLAFVLMPGTVGPQDLAAYAMAPAAVERPRPVAPSFGLLHLATFGGLQPLGTAMAKPLDPMLVRLVPRDMAGEGAVASAAPDFARPRLVFPTVDRSHKSDALLPPARSEPADDADAAPANPITGLSDDDGVWPELGASDLATSLNPAMDMARLYFGPGVMDAPLTALEREEDAGADATLSASRDLDIKRSAVAPADAHAKLEQSKPGETVAGKGEVTGAGRHPRSPAERLGLAGKARAKAERCLANAVYFESRSEPVRGQIAVAQVVMNRVFSDFYPNDVCEVVYQNANRHLACQFTFACDGIPDIVTEPAAWRRAKRIAKDMLDGKLWLAEVGRATHYHAYWVHPYWVHEMKKLYKLGVHTFYRPRAWGDGSDEPAWGDPKQTAALVKKL